MLDSAFCVPVFLMLADLSPRLPERLQSIPSPAGGKLSQKASGLLKTRLKLSSPNPRLD